MGKILHRQGAPPSLIPPRHSIFFFLYLFPPLASGPYVFTYGVDVVFLYIIYAPHHKFNNHLHPTNKIKRKKINKFLLQRDVKGRFSKDKIEFLMGSNYKSDKVSSSSL